MKTLHRDHSGGAWKVAYADFVTSMMCLFMVLWIVAAGREIRESIAGYFRAHAILKSLPDGFGFDRPMARIRPPPTPVRPPEQAATSGSGGCSWAARMIMLQTARDQAASKFLKALQPNSANNRELTDTDEYRLEFLNDGFRLNIMDRSRKPVFEEGGARLTEHGRWVLQTLAWEISRFPFRLEIEGHTRGEERLGEGMASLWDLSAQRALATQRILSERVISSQQFWRVAGYADRRPLDPEHPDSELNRRLSIVMRLDPNTDIQELRRAFELP